VGAHQIRQVKLNLIHKTELQSTSVKTTQNNQFRIPVDIDAYSIVPIVTFA